MYREYERHDSTRQWFGSYGNELWEFDDTGLMRRRIASSNVAEIAEAHLAYGEGIDHVGAGITALSS